MKNLAFLLITLTFLISCNCKRQPKINKVDTVAAINTFMNDWHKDASQANFDAYFNKIDSLGYFIGTDESEVWTKTEFAAFSKPYFDRKKAWNFKPLKRNIHLNKQGDMAWFDEILDTWMGICRGSGVIQKVGTDWKIKHYVLSVTIPNADIKPVMAAKNVNDSIALAKYKKR
ncbi:MAG: nuclear transport factor 2 family protein [Flavobacteriaceae bacterium]|nr:nuclear transport factor 2 family protein [Flavobacteriaceae bacterium]